MGSELKDRLDEERWEKHMRSLPQSKREQYFGTKMLHRLGLTISGEWVEGWCGCGWKYHPSETHGTRLERLRRAHRRGQKHVRDTR